MDLISFTSIQDIVGWDICKEFRRYLFCKCQPGKHDKFYIERSSHNFYTLFLYFRNF